MKSKNLIDSFNNAINGIIYAIRIERNMKIHFVTAILVLILSLFYDLTRTELLIVCLSIGAVIICELFNTAVEVMVDIVVDAYHPKAKIVKDVAAGAVMVSAFISLVVAYLIFFDRISSEIEIGIRRIKQLPMLITIISLIIAIILVLTFKAFLKQGTYLSGGMPSGHTAIAFSIATGLSLWTGDARIAALCIILALMVAQSRLETKIHSIYEVAVGSVLGFLVTLLMFQVFYT